MKLGEGMNSKRLIAQLSLLATAIIWGFGFIAVEIALNGGWTTFSLLAIRGLIAGVLLTLVSFKRRWWENKSCMLSGMLCGFFLFVAFSLQTFGQQYSTASNSAFLTALNVVFIPLILRGIFKEKLRKRVYLACLIALIGAGFLSLNASFSLRLGDALLMLGALGFACHIIATGKIGRFEALSFTAVQMFTMSFCSFIVCIFVPQTFTTQGLGAVVFTAVFCSAVAFFLQTYGQRTVHSSVASLILALESVFGTLASVFILHESLTIQMIVGGACLLVAVLIAQKE